MALQWRATALPDSDISRAADGASRWVVSARKLFEIAMWAYRISEAKSFFGPLPSHAAHTLCHACMMTPSPRRGAQAKCADPFADAALDAIELELLLAVSDGGG